MKEPRMLSSSQETRFVMLTEDVHEICSVIKRSN